jgi:sulfotransferase
MEKKYYFLSGLPRSGSTLLSSILNQNPKIYSGPGSPVVDLMFGAETFLRKCEQLRAYPNDNFIQTHISSIIKDFYKDIEKEVIIDKSRAWPNNINLIQKLAGHSKVKTTMIYTHISHNLISKIQSPLGAINL